MFFSLSIIMIQTFRWFNQYLPYELVYLNQWYKMLPKGRRIEGGGLFPYRTPDRLCQRHVHCAFPRDKLSPK